jgi:hypothetical protein
LWITGWVPLGFVYWAFWFVFDPWFDEFHWMGLYLDEMYGDFLALVLIVWVFVCTILWWCFLEVCWWNLVVNGGWFWDSLLWPCVLKWWIRGVVLIHLIWRKIGILFWGYFNWYGSLANFEWFWWCWSVEVLIVPIVLVWFS